MKSTQAHILSIIMATLLCLLSCIHPTAVHSATRSTDFPRRIVSLGPINTENIYLLGAGDRLVGNTSYCNRPKAAKNITKIGSVMQFSLEKIISLRPDLILATGLTRPESIKKLLNLDLHVVQFNQPNSFAEICNQFISLGQLLGRREQAEKIVNQTRIKVSTVEKKAATLRKEKVFLQVGSRPLFGSVNNSFTHDFITMGGGINITGNQVTGTTSYEKVIALNPEVIIIAIMGSESGIAGREKEHWLRIPVLHAVQNNRVHIINPDLVCSPSPVTFARTLQRIAELIHPGINMTSRKGVYVP